MLKRPEHTLTKLFAAAAVLLAAVAVPTLPTSAAPLLVPKVSIRTTPTCNPPDFEVRPHVIFLECMLSDLFLAGNGVPILDEAYTNGLQWQTWGPQTASATGALWENSCNPDCAGSQYWFMQSAQVQLSGLTITSCGLLFSTLSFRLATRESSQHVMLWQPWEREPLPTNCK